MLEVYSHVVFMLIPFVSGNINIANIRPEKLPTENSHIQPYSPIISDSGNTNLENKKIKMHNNIIQ